MASSKSSSLTGKTLLIIVLIAALVGAGSGAAAVYLTGERHLGVATQTRDFYLFTSTLPFTETPAHPTHDIFSPDRIIVNLGDKVIVHFFNVEDVNENHTFTLEAPFWTQSGVTVQGASWNGGNVILQQNQEANITFTATDAGVFAYRCTIHQPEMTGYVVVLLP